MYPTFYNSVHEKTEAVEYFKSLAADMQTDKYHKAEFDYGIGFMGDYAYVSNNILRAKVKIRDRLPCTPLYWSYDDETCVSMPETFKSRISSYHFDRVDSKTVFLRVKDIAEISPKLTPLKKCVSAFRIEAEDDNMILSTVKGGSVLSQKYCEKNFFANKKMSESEKFQGVFDMNLFYIEKIALEKNFNCDIIGIRLWKKSAEIFVKKGIYKAEYIINGV